MTKPATGFLTEDGKFFEEEHEAQAHEATVMLETHLRLFLDKHGYDTRTLTFTMDVMQFFMLSNRSLITDYVTSSASPPPEPNPDDPRRLLGQLKAVDKTTGPVNELRFKVEVEDGGLVYERLDDIPDELTSSEDDLDAALESDFIQGLDQTVGEDDRSGAESGGDAVDRQSQSDQSGLHQRVRGRGIPLVEVE